MSNLVQELKTKVEELLSHASELKAALDQVESAPTGEQALTAAVIAALEAQGYTVTAPASPNGAEAENQSQDGQQQ